MDPHDDFCHDAVQKAECWMWSTGNDGPSICWQHMAAFTVVHLVRRCKQQIDGGHLLWHSGDGERTCYSKILKFRVWGKVAEGWANFCYILIRQAKQHSFSRFTEGVMLFCWQPMLRWRLPLIFIRSEYVHLRFVQPFLVCCIFCIFLLAQNLCCWISGLLISACVNGSDS